MLNVTVKVLQIIGSTSFITKREIPSTADDIVLITSRISPGAVSFNSKELSLWENPGEASASKSNGSKIYAERCVEASLKAYFCKIFI